MEIIHSIATKHPKKIDLEEYWSLWKNGLSEEKHPAASHLRVAIVGAGMAGLIAANLLGRVGFKVQIFEASQRVGGRIRTLRDGFSTGLHAEAGAMRIPKNHRLVRRLCKQLKLKLIDFPEDDKNALVYVNGTRRQRFDYEKGIVLGTPYVPKRTARQALDLAMEPLTRKRRPPLDESRLDHVSFGEYLRTFTKDNATNPVTEEAIPKALITSADIDLIGLEFGAADLKASLLEAYRDDTNIQAGGKSQIDGGMDRLPIALSKDLSEKIIFNARVTEITRFGGKRFKVHYEHSYTHMSFEPESADIIILAAPFSALTHVRLDSVMIDDPKRLHAIRTLHYENATKIILEFKKRFWEDKYDIHGGKSFTDLPLRWVYYPSDKEHLEGSSRGLLLASYTWGEDSLRWGSLNEEDRIRFALRDIATLHREEGKCEQLLVGGMSHSWAEDEYTFGAFSIFEPHQETELFDSMWKSHNQIYFAGEHTSLKHAWIEGALESGIRAAAQVFHESIE